MATGDIQAGFSSADIKSLVDLLSPAGSSTTSTSPEDTTKTTGPSSKTDNIGSSSTNTNATQNVSQNTSSTVGPSTSTLTHGAQHTENTVQQIVSPEAVTELVNQILSGTQGLSAVTSGQHVSGAYNTTTNTMLTNDLVASTAGQAALLNKKTVTTNDVAASTDVTQNSGYTTSGTTNTVANTLTNVANSGSVNSSLLSGSTDTVHTSGNVVDKKMAPQIPTSLQKLGVVAGVGGWLVNAAGQKVVSAAGSFIKDTLFGSSATAASGPGQAALASTMEDAMLNDAYTAPLLSDVSGEVAGGAADTFLAGPGSAGSAGVLDAGAEAASALSGAGELASTGQAALASDIEASFMSDALAGDSLASAVLGNGAATAATGAAGSGLGAAAGLGLVGGALAVGLLFNAWSTKDSAPRIENLNKTEQDNFISGLAGGASPGSAEYKRVEDMWRPKGVWYADTNPNQVIIDVPALLKASAK